MIVVVGSPIARPVGDGVVAGGLAAAFGREAAARGAAVQLVGRVGDDPAGDLTLLDLAAHGVGHVAVLREPGRSTPAAPPESGTSHWPGEPTLDNAPLSIDDDDPASAEADVPAGLSVDAADVELALRYVPDYRVLVCVVTLDDAALRAVVAASSWSGAHLVVLIPSGAELPAVPEDATVLERPAADPDGDFVTMVATYVAAVDAGTEPGAAFKAAQGGGGWAAVAE